jgi:pyruvate/2-oxoacid:ferredoxin oxidoreductase beta subunit
LEEFLKVQRRLSHLLLPENADLLEKLKAYVNERWERLNKLSTCFA